MNVNGHRARAPSGAGTRAHRGTYMQLLVWGFLWWRLLKPKAVTLLLETTSHHYIEPFPYSQSLIGGFTRPLDFPDAFPLPFCVPGQWCSLPPPVLLASPTFVLYISGRCSAFTFIFFSPLASPLGFLAQLEKIRLISSVPSMLLGKLSIHLISHWLPFTFPAPHMFKFIFTCNFPTGFSPPQS